MSGTESDATEQLFAVLYDDLRRLAHGRLQRNEPITLLETTALVHETYRRVLNARHIELS